LPALIGAVEPTSANATTTFGVQVRVHHAEFPVPAPDPLQLLVLLSHLRLAVCCESTLDHARTIFFRIILLERLESVNATYPTHCS
jgi:hypothetical protein